MCDYAGIERERCIVINDDATLSLMYQHHSWSRDLFISYHPIRNSGRTSRLNVGGEGSSRPRGRRGYASSDEDYNVPRRTDYHVFSNMDGPDEVTNRRIPSGPELYNTIKLGTHFSNKEELHGAPAIWSTIRGAKYRVTASDRKTWAAECINRPNKRTKQPYDGIVCNWKIRASFKSEYRTWQITVWCDGHNCDGANNEREDRNISQAHVAHVIVDKIRDRPNYPIKSIIFDCEAAFGCKIWKKKAWDGKRVAMNQWKFKKEEGDVHSRRKIFRYVFWHFGATRLTFQHSPPVVTVDATHLRGAYKGKAVVAVVKTANNRVVPVAYAIVDEESNHSWYWFLKYLKIYVLQDTFTCIISDRHSGILFAIVKLNRKFPNWGVHRYCMEHVVNLMSSVPKKKGLYALSWSVGTELDEDKYMKAWADLIETSQAASTYLQRIPLEKWTLFLDGFHRWGTTTSNDVESYNNILRGDRFLPIRAFVQATHAKTMAILTDEMTKINRYRSSALAAIPTETFDANKMCCRRYSISLYPNAPERTFSVRSPSLRLGVEGREHTVQFDMGSCTCLGWNTYMIPCAHAMAVAKVVVAKELTSDCGARGTTRT
ncbi:uncharacterized protein [Rutidosis leptorrhynchoides]|uniref:uncharacterized protein n=1 Tax=Rutidosis leptorrhynchoides TaxID=125765 RepID=UPI003A9A0005